MRLLSAFEGLFASTRPAFSQDRTFDRIRRLAFGFVVAWGRRTISRAICACNDQFVDWSGTYRLFSRSPWQPNDVFDPILRTCLARSEDAGHFVVALDDTTLKKTGKKIPGVSYGRDPMSPPFHCNLQRGQRFIQSSAILRPEGLDGPARAVPIRFHPAPPPAKPKKRASDEEWAAYKLAQKTQNLSKKAVGLIDNIRQSIDNAGYSGRTLMLVVDGSYCNSTVLRNLPEKVEVVARARGDMSLFSPLPPDTKGRRRKYGPQLPKPKEMLSSDEYPWLETPIFGAGRIHNLRHKVIPDVLWRSGTLTRPLRLIIVAPLRYRLTAKSRLLYRDPAYLLTTDLNTPVETLIQAYFDRWEIEVNIRDEKSLLGVGQAQVWSGKAVFRVPQFQVAIYAMLLLASLEAYGPKRTKDYLPSPKWRKQEERRPSTLDIIALLREEILSSAISQPPLTEAHSNSGAGPLASRLNVLRPAENTPIRKRISATTTRVNPPADIVVAAFYAAT